MASRQGGRRRRRGAATTAAAAIGLCLATVTTTHTSLAFHLHTGTHGIVASSSSSAVGGCDDAKTTAGGRRRSATAAAACRGPSSPPQPPPDDRPEHHDADSSGSNGKGGGGAAKELSAALLSAMLLGNPQVSGAATATAQGPSTADQSRLMADLERRLTSVSSGPTAATTDPPGNAAAAAPASPAGRAEAPTAATVDSAPRVQSMFVPPSSMTPQAQAGAASEEAAAAAAAAGQRRQAGSSTPVPKPAIKMKEYKFTVKLPEFDVPTVGPITVPEEGNVFAGMEPRAIFKAPSRERVVAQPEFPGAGAVRGALESVGKGDGVKELTDAFAAAVPRQGDYNRAVMEFEERVSQLVKTTDNPTFAPGVPLAPEFASMLSKAKETAFNGIRPYLPKGAEPELALFMLVTLPVLTVALRSADENSRRPKPDPLPPASRPPRITRFPNSPAKVDAAAVAEARKEREAQADVDAVATLREELAVRGLAAVPVAEGASPAAAAAEVLHGGVAAAAVAAKPDAITAELARLREELAAAGKLAAKVEALERANARLMGQVADLSKTPSIEEVRLRAEKEAMRAAAQREREEAQEAAYAGVQEKATKLSAAREKLSDAFPARESLAAVAASSAKKSPAASAKKPAASKKPAAAKKAAAKKPAAKKPAAKKPAAAASTKKKKPVETKKKKAEAAPAKKAKAPGRKKAAAAAAADDPPAVESPEPTMLHNGASVLKEGTETVVAAAAAAAGEAVTPNEYEDMSEDLSRAVLGVQGYDMDGLDLEMADLRPEDLEELLALEMGGLDMASRDEEDFGLEDDESMSQGLRMAAESALAHTSGGGAGRRIRTASPVGATSFRSTGGGSAAVVAESRGGAPQATAVRDGEGVGFSSVPSATTEDDELAAFRRLEAEAVADFGTGAAGWGDQAAGGAAAAVGGGAGGVPQDDGDWGALSAKAVGRKTVAALKEFLDEEGMDYPSKIRKAELVDMVLNMLAEG